MEVIRRHGLDPSVVVGDTDLNHRVAFLDKPHFLPDGVYNRKSHSNLVQIYSIHLDTACFLEVNVLWR